MKQDINKESFDYIIAHLENLKENVFELTTIYDDVYRELSKICDGLEDLRDELYEAEKN